MHYMVRACVKARRRQLGPLRARAPDMQTDDGPKKTRLRILDRDSRGVVNNAFDS